MATSILQIFVSVFGYFAARGIDSIIGKWVAMIRVAWEKSGSDSAMKTYHDTMTDLVNQMAGKSQDWENWRKKNLGNGPHS